MSAFWVLARLRVLDVLRSRSATFAFLGLPVAILVVLSLVFADGHPFEERRITCVGQDPSVLAAERGLSRFGVRQESELDVALARRKLRTRGTSAVLFRSGSGELTLEVSRKEELWGRGVAGVLGARLETRELPRFGYVQYLFPGLLCSSVMFAGLFGMGYAMARYRRNQFLKKLSTLPVSRGTFVLAQIAGRGSLVVVQIALLLAAALLGFGVSPSWAGLVTTTLVCLVGLFVFSGIGFALASLIETEAVVSDVISGLTLPFVLFSGVFFPLDTLPSWLARAAALLPSSLMVEATRATLLYDAGLAAVEAQLFGLAVWGIVMFGLSVRLFRWHE